MAKLKADVCELAEVSSDTPVLLASRSSQLMKLAARLLFQQCRCILIADLAWPGYTEILERERDRVGGTIIRVPLRHRILWNDADADCIAKLIADYARQFGSDGLFLPAVSHDGIRLPVESICRRLRSVCDLRFVVVDGAQAFCHTPSVNVSSVDFYITGAHKWLRAMHPLGIAFLPNPNSREFLRAACQQLLRNGEIDDPLLAFTNSLENGRLPAFTETVNTLPLFTAQAAAAKALSSPLIRAEQFAIQLENASLMAELCDDTEWQPVRLNQELRSGIVLLKSRIAWNVTASSLQEDFAIFGIGLTAYPDGWLRLALPQRPLSEDDVIRIRRALCTPQHSATGSVRSSRRFDCSTTFISPAIPAGI